jgi:mRNA interferase HicA
MKGSELIHRVRRLGRRRGIPVEILAERGKGSHRLLYFGDHRTVIPNAKDELKTGTLQTILKQLGLTVQDLQE